MNHSHIIDQIIKERRTIKKFKEERVPTEEIIDILEVAKYAPNHKMTEPWRFILFQKEQMAIFADAFEKAALHKHGEVHARAQAKSAHYREDIPMTLVVTMEESTDEKTWDEDFGAVSALIQNIQLAAWARGIGMIWRTNRYIYEDTFKEAIGVQPNERIVATLMIGYPDFIPPAKERTPIQEKLTIVE